MASHSPDPVVNQSPKVPFLVVLVALYELAKAGFFGWFFWECWQAQGSGIPPFGDVELHSAVFEAPYFLIFPLLAVFHLVLGFGLSALANWARAGCALLLVGAIPWWMLEHIFGYASLTLPVDTSLILAALALESIVLTILYVPSGVRHAFVPEE